MIDKDFIKKKAKMIYPFVIYGKLNSKIESDYISKDKIREKIKELEWYGEYIKYRFVYTDYDKEVNKVKIEVLKELLEE